MIKFFRKIRYNLMSENKTGKYLKYAIGEIVLVVIGILIALQVNNYNNYVKDRRTEQLMLIKLHDESEAIVSYIKENNIVAEQYINGIEQSVRAISSKSMNGLNNNEFENGVINVGFYPGITPPKSVYEELNSSGKLQLIQNDSILRYISDYYSQLSFVNSQLNYFRIFVQNPDSVGGRSFLSVYDDKNPYKRRVIFDFDELVNNPEFLSSMVQGLRDQIAFHTNRVSLLEKAERMCSSLGLLINADCG
jgi:hypothetical protein